MRVAEAPEGWRQIKKTDGEGGATFCLEGSGRQARFPKSCVIRGEDREPPHADRKWSQLAESCAQCVAAAPKIEALAIALGVAPSALRRLQVGWHDGRQAWTAPVCNGFEEPCGLHLRAVDGRKQLMSGSAAGVFLPASWQEEAEQAGEIWLVEGLSDCAALLSHGYAALGRHSCAGGAQHLVPLIGSLSPSVKVTVLADSDRPGKRGAAALAEQLAQRLGRPVSWRHVTGAKDSRESLSRGSLTLSDPVTIEPHADPFIGVFKTPAGALPDAVRQQVHEAVMSLLPRIGEKLTAPSFCLLRSGCGSGKSYAVAQLLKAIGDRRWTLCLPTHRNCAERIEELREAGVDAIGYAPWSEQTCARHSQLLSMVQSGITPGQAVCPNCACAFGCPYLQASRQAGAARHKVVTAERLIRSEASDEGADLVVVDEQADRIFSGWQSVSVEDIRSALSWLETFVADLTVQSKVQAGVEALLALSDTMPIGGQQDHLIADPLEGGWLVAAALEARGAGCEAWPENGALALIERHLAGYPTRLVRSAYADTRLIAVSSAKRSWPACHVLIVDASGSAERIGRDCQDITPDLQLLPRHERLQIPVSISRKTSIRSVIAVLRWCMSQAPIGKRWCVIGLKTHVDQLRRTGALAPFDVTLLHFGEGADRGSNSLAAEHDVILVCGDFRAPEAAIRLALPATAPLDGDFGAVRWQAASGETIEHRQYRSAGWREADEALSLEAVWQATGRARSSLESGKPLIFVGTTPLMDTRIVELPESSAALSGLALVMQAAEALWSDSGEAPDHVYRRTVSREQIGDLSSVSYRQVSEQLSAACRERLIFRRGRGEYGLSEGNLHDIKLLA